jgi:chemotaxis protein histidine kinase CheA
LKAEYRFLDNGHVMVVLTDVTEEHRLSKKVANERLHLAMIVTAVTDSRDFFDAVDSFRQFYRNDLAQILPARASPQSICQEVCRQIHTFKGTFAQLNFDTTPKMLHALEGRFGELLRQGDKVVIGKIVEQALSVDYHGTLESDLAVVRQALGEEFLDHGKGVFLPMPQARKLRAVAERLLEGARLDLDSAEIKELFAEFRNLDKVSLASALAVYERVVLDVAKRLNKEVSPLSIDGGKDLWLDPELYGPFLRSLVHVFRNAVVHGIEDPEERLARGKDPSGSIDCVIHHQGNGFTLMIADDGRGVDLNALREQVVSIGLMSREKAFALSDDEVLALIFADDVSAREKADELAGRGVGLAAVRAETDALGGNVTVTSSPGQGARFVFSFPSLRLGESSFVDAGIA